MTVTLKPCPFCGKDPDPQILEPHSHAVTFGGFKMPDYPGGATVECDCGAGLIDDSLEVVVARWNTRAADASLAASQAEIARLRGALEPDRIGGDFLDWVADRLVKTHGDSENADFVIALRRIAQNVQNALEQVK